jgi:hypothetical protein
MENFNASNNTNPATKKTEEQVREEIRGNLMICCDSWSIENLAMLEQCASMMGQLGMSLHGQEFVGMRKIDQLMFDANGQFKLSDDPKSENSFFKALATCLEEQKDILAQEKAVMEAGKEAKKMFDASDLFDAFSGPDSNATSKPTNESGYEFF